MYRRQRSGFDRVPFAQVCEVESDGTRQRGMVCNLSILGAYIHTATLPERNKAVTLSFRLPDDGPLMLAAGTVTWVNDGNEDGTTPLPRGFGVRFLSAAPDDLRRIATLVASFLASPQPQYQVGVGMPPSGKARIPFVGPLVFFGKSRESRGSVCNLSTLGLYAALEQMPDEGEEGRVRFTVPGIAGDFEVGAVVTWINPEHPRKMPALPSGCGLRFVNLSLIDEAILATAVESYLAAANSERGEVVAAPASAEAEAEA